MKTNSILFLQGIGFFGGLMLCTVMAAYRGNALTLSQMRRQGIQTGLPLLCHPGMFWGDIVISIVAAWLFAEYSERWNTTTLFRVFMTTGLVTVLFHVQWVNNKGFDSLAKDGLLTKAGMFHIPYMTAALTVLWMFYFHSGALDKRTLVGVSILLSLHVFAGLLKILDFIQPSFWDRRPYEDRFGWFVLAATWVMIWSRTAYLLIT